MLKAHLGEKAEHGFDLTGFGTAQNFKTVLKENNMKPAKPVIHKLTTGGSYKSYVFKGQGVEMRTGNNPITGQYSCPRQRQNEKGYASYIGIKGEPAKVQKLVMSIKKHTDDIKDESAGRNDFIW
jgi:hypothetical protein